MTRAGDPGPRSIASATPRTSRPSENVAASAASPLIRAPRVDYWSRLLCVLLDTQASHSVRSSPVL